jgi:hypothetical protein
MHPLAQEDTTFHEAKVKTCSSKHPAESLL